MGYYNLSYVSKRHNQFLVLFDEYQFWDAKSWYILTFQQN